LKKVIAIDGPSGAGKSTIAKLISKELGYAYLDTGALYRAVALGLVHLGIHELSSDKALIQALKRTKVEFRNGLILLNDKDVSGEIRSPEAGHYASVFSAKRPVREHLMNIQRDAALHSDLVAEGRDMTTEVFPAAYKKFYLDASVEERSGRRTLELISRGFEVDENRIRLDIMQRDARDSTRDIAPLKKTDDAYLIDSTGLSIDDVFQKILAIIKKDPHEK
jgi:cytidylate kinase